MSELLRLAEGTFEITSRRSPSDFDAAGRTKKAFAMRVSGCREVLYGRMGQESFEIFRFIVAGTDRFVPRRIS